MNSRKILVLLLAACTTGILFFPSCNRDLQVGGDTGNLVLHLHTYIDSQLITAYGYTDTLSNGRQISVSAAQMYLSGIQLIKADGSVYSLGDTVKLQIANIENYEISGVPTGSYTGISFNVGIDSLRNDTITSPLTTNEVFYHPEMYFGATPQPDGYAFVYFSGSIDTTAAANSSTLIPFTYKIGTNANLRTVTLNSGSFSVALGEPNNLDVDIDYNRLFNGVDLSNNANLTVTTAADNSSANAQHIAGNISSMFRLQ